MQEFRLDLDATAQVDSIDHLGIVKGWDSVKKKAQLVLCMPLELRSVLEQTVKKKSEKFESPDEEYGAYKDAAIEVLDQNKGKPDSFGEILSRLPSKGTNIKQSYNKMATKIKQAKPFFENAVIEELCIENLLQSLPQVFKTLVSMKRSEGLDAMVSIASDYFENNKNEIIGLVNEKKTTSGSFVI